MPICTGKSKFKNLPPWRGDYSGFLILSSSEQSMLLDTDIQPNNKYFGTSIDIH